MRNASKVKGDIKLPLRVDLSRESIFAKFYLLLKKIKILTNFKRITAFYQACDP